MSIRVSNIQRFSLNDGSGIRTTVFLKGCPLRCPWCCNPENIDFNYSYFFDKDKCISYKNKCFIDNYCKRLKDNNYAKVVNENCPAIEKVGKDYTPVQLLAEILKDKDFYGNSGGVTFSGGEPFFQSKNLLPLLKVLKQNKINITFETSLSVPLDNIKEILNYIDFLYIDMKVLNKDCAKKDIGLDVNIYMNNLGFISENYKINNVIIRIPLVEDYTYTKNNAFLIKQAISKYKFKKIEVFSVHNLGVEKYIKMNKRYKKFNILNYDDINVFIDEIKTNLVDIKILSL